MERLIDEQRDILRDKLLLLGGSTEKALVRAIEALTERDSELAKRVIDEDRLINRMELEIDQLCIEILALHQPAASDLRFVISIAKITPVLERIADHASNIASSAMVLSTEPYADGYADMIFMADIAGEMLRDALNAFTSEDSEASRKIIKRDKEIDRTYDKVFGNLIQNMESKPTSTTAAAHLLFVAKHLERIGDYVKDICELNVYLNEAEIIKHRKKR